MLKVENETLLWKNRPATVRDLIISEDLLQQIDFDESNEAYSTMVVVNNQLIYILKYKSGCLKDNWHFAQQKLNVGKQVYLYEQRNLYIGA